MKVLRIIASMDPASGGPCQGIRNSIPALCNLGVMHEVVSLDAANADFLGSDSFPIHTLGPGRGSWAHAPALRPWLMDNLSRFDVVIIHGLWQYHGYAVCKTIRKLRSRARESAIRLPRIYLMPHGMLDPYFQRDPSRRIKAIRNWAYWKFVEGKVANSSDGILFTCAEEMHLAQNTFSPYHPKQQLNIGYGVEEPPSFTPGMKAAFAAKCPDLGDRPYLLFLSRIHPKKGVDLLIRAYADLHRARQKKEPSTDNQPPTTDRSSSLFPRLVIAGPLDSAYAREMQQLAAELLPTTAAHSSPATQNPAIHFPGMLSGDVKWGAFYGCEAFILPSHQENFGIAVVEALACGKPVLISNQVNIWREIVDSGAGLAEANTLEGTTSLVNQWLKIRTKGTPFAANALECYAKHFSIKQAAQSLSQVIRH